MSPLTTSNEWTPSLLCPHSLLAPCLPFFCSVSQVHFHFHFLAEWLGRHWQLLLLAAAVATHNAEDCTRRAQFASLASFRSVPFSRPCLAEPSLSLLSDLEVSAFCSLSGKVLTQFSGCGGWWSQGWHPETAEKSARGHQVYGGVQGKPAERERQGGGAITAVSGYQA